jgi:hypothetical protein
MSKEHSRGRVDKGRPAAAPAPTCAATGWRTLPPGLPCRRRKARSPHHAPQRTRQAAAVEVPLSEALPEGQHAEHEHHTGREQAEPGQHSAEDEGVLELRG